MANSLENRAIGYQIKILHTTPDQYPKFVEPGKYHIGRVFWETDKIPNSWVAPIKLLDEIWTGSEFNAQAIRNAGVVDIPIYIVPEAIDIDVPEFEPYLHTIAEPFVFYSIFEWTERKNPKTLLKAYWEEFEKTNNVAFMLKTYVDNFTLERKTEIKQEITRLKRHLNLTRFAPVYLYLDLMDRHQVYRFHKTGTCFVSAHRGEGWGVPQMEAMLLGNPIISTNCGGLHEYLTDKENALLVNYNLVPLTENSRNKQWYTPDQKWADVDFEQLKRQLRWAYNHQPSLKKIAQRGQLLVKNKFSIEAVGKLMHERLVQVHNEIASKWGVNATVGV